MLDAVVDDAKFERNIEKMNDTADPLAVIRNALSAQVDQNAIVVLSGPATNLAGLLALPLDPALIAQKAQKLVIAADAPTLSDAAAMRRVLAEWPTPIVVADAALGDAFPFPGASIEKDFAWSEEHPIVAAYKAYRAMPYDAPATAMAAGIVRRPSAGELLQGRASRVPSRSATMAKLKHTPGAGGKHKALLADPTQKDKIQQIYAEMASTHPIPRPQRFRPQQKKKQ